MRGCPKTFETKMDYQNGLKLYPEQVRSSLRQLIASRFVFVKERELEDSEEGITDENHMVMTETENGSEDDSGKTKRWQMVKQEDPNARLFRLGFTVKEAESLL